MTLPASFAIERLGKKYLDCQAHSLSRMDAGLHVFFVALTDLFSQHPLWLKMTDYQKLRG